MMLTVTATIRRMIDKPDQLLVSFQELAAYYPAHGPVADFFRTFQPGTVVTFTHDIRLAIAHAVRADHQSSFRERGC
jgi:hypothetical protein